jgi:ribonuclease-3
MRLGRGEQEGGGRDRQALLCGTFEALIAAMYLSAGMAAVQSFIEPYLRDAADQIVSTRRDRDPKSLFQEWVQAQGLGPPYYRIISTSGPEHEKTFEVEVIVNGESYGFGIGLSKQAAAKEAARAALAKLGVE